MLYWQGGGKETDGVGPASPCCCHFIIWKGSSSLKRWETVRAEREREKCFLFLRRGGQGSVSAMSLPAKNVKRWRETKERRFGGGSGGGSGGGVSE